ncbi:MAG: PP2C family protein-serine/threonine phosphatase [Candidatus Hydrogenedentota bacterium]
MALRFRTRLNLTFTSLIFLVVVVMTVSQIGILLYDTWTNNWYKGQVLTDLIKPNISEGLRTQQRVAEYLGEYPPPISAESSTDALMANFSTQSLLERFMLMEEFNAMIIVNSSGVAIAEVFSPDFESSKSVRKSIDRFIKNFIETVSIDEEDQVSYRWFGQDFGVVTPLAYPQDSDTRYGLFVLHSSTRQAQLIGDRLGVLTIIGTILFFIALIVCMLVSRGLTKPLLELSRGAKEFGEGNLNYRMKLRRKDEFNDLAQSFNIMAISIQEYMHELERETGKRERLESEFRIASEMQRALLPEAPPVVDGLEIIGWSRPSKEVGGDFYDFLELAPGKIGLVLGDATGKGVPAALLTTQCASALRTLSGQFSDPSELLQRTNHEFHKRVGATHRFVTLFLMVIDTETGIAHYASAGHPTPLLVNSRTAGSRWLEEASGFPLGIVAEAQYDAHEIQLTPGDTILIFSDGLTDARNHDDVLYGEAHIQTSVESLTEVTVDSVLDKTRSDVERYMNGKEAADDMTIVVTKYTGNGSV